MPTARYLSHAQVVQDPNIPVPQWRLSDEGRNRIATLAATKVLAGTKVIYSSTEVKAIETASPLAAALGCPHYRRADMGENDRSATGFLPNAEFEAAANAFFANPNQSHQGWETSRAAQTRIVAAVDTALTEHRGKDILFVGHGAVGTLLYCALSGLTIDRRHDQPHGGGNIFCFDTVTRQPDGPWRSLEDFIKASTH